MIKFDNVSFAYEKSYPVLKNVSFVLSNGLNFIFGPNGCGKTTLMKLAAGIEKPNSGLITINDFDLWKKEVVARKDIAYLPEHPDLTPYATLKEILDLVCRLRGIPLSQGHDTLKFFGLESFANRTVRELSKGQRRRAIFSTVLVGSPRYILLDEPLDGMDKDIRKVILSWIRGQVRVGSCLVVISHTIEPFADMITHTLTIRNGQTEAYREIPDP